MSLNIKDIVWYSRDYDGVEPIFRCGDFHNVPLIGAKGGLNNCNLVLSLCQLGYPLKDKPEDKQLEEFMIAEGVDGSELLKRVHRVWGKAQHIGKKEFGKQNCIALEPYTYWVKARVQTIKLPYPWEPSMSLKPPRYSVVSIYEVDKFKETIKFLQKENVDLQSDLSKLTQEKEDFKINLNQNKERILKAIEVSQVEKKKQRKIDDALKGTYVGLSTKKKQLAET